MSRLNVGVVDYGVGNLMSVGSAAKKCGANVVCSANPDLIYSSDLIILPGVGAFATGSRALERLGMFEAIKAAAKKGIPILGICLGMQLLFQRGEEFGISEGLGLMKGNVVPLPTITPSGLTLKTPHIGWSELVQLDEPRWCNSPLSSLKLGESVYFVHSFVAQPENSKNIVAGFSFGGKVFPAFVQEDNVFGCQFHPEKSGVPGITIIKNFISSV